MAGLRFPDRERCVASFLSDDADGAVERGRVLDPFAVAVGGLADLFEGRQVVEMGEGRRVAAATRPPGE
jgi:hypothetical protein